MIYSWTEKEETVEHMLSQVYQKYNIIEIEFVECINPAIIRKPCASVMTDVFVFTYNFKKVIKCYNTTEKIRYCLLISDKYKWVILTNTCGL